MSTIAKRLDQVTPIGSQRTLAEQAFGSLHEAIVTGALEPGQRLPIEELAAVLDMSPMPIRKALRRLDAGGMIENLPHRGARVTELSVDDLREVYQARLALEPLAVCEAAEGFTKAEEAAARAALKRHREAIRADDLARTWTAHTEFHFTFYRAAGSRWLIRLITPLWETSERYRHATGSINWRLDERQREHDRILDACVARAPDRVAAELHNHLVVTANDVSRQMGGPAELFDRVEVPATAAGPTRS